MKLRQYLVRLIDRFYREPKLIKRYYQAPLPALDLRDRYIFMVDGRVHHGGMFDRLKGALSVYAVAKAQNKDFCIHWKYPFRLEKYLEPNVHNWTIEDKDICYHYPDSRPLFLYGECYDARRLMVDRKGESHFYYGYNSLMEINKQFHTQYDWGTLYCELFRPTAYLQKYLDQYKHEIGCDYIAIHTRFMNLLGDNTETSANPELEDDEQKVVLMSKAVDAIKRIPSTFRILIASDSMTFIDYVRKEIPHIYIVPGTVKHIDTAGETDDTENIKMFTDYYLIAGAKKVYSLWHQGMWKSAFPEYAAKIGNVPFERIKF